MRWNTVLIGMLAGGAMSMSAIAGGGPTIETLVIEGDELDDGTIVSGISNIAINNQGLWHVEVDTDFPDTDADSRLLRDGAIFLGEGDPLSMPKGATLDSFDSIGLNNFGIGGFNFFLDGTDGFGDDSGVYVDLTLLIQESDTTDVGDLTPGTPFIGFFDVKINDPNQLLVLASVDDPNIPSSVDRAIITVDSGLDGGSKGQTLIAREGEILPGQSEPTNDFETGPHDIAFNNLGQVMFIADVGTDSAVNGVIYLDDSILAQEGSASPVEDRDWETLTSGVVDLNNNSGYVYKGSLDGDNATDTLIVRNNKKFKQEGDAAPGKFAFESFGTGPVLIDDSGSVLWYGVWNDPDGDIDSGLFLNDELLVQEGVSQIDGVTIDTLRGIQDGYTMSDDGSSIVFEAVLANGNEGAFRIEVEPPSDCEGDVSGDNMVNSLDLNIVLSEFGNSEPEPTEGDADGDGDVDADDLNIVLGNFGESCG